MNQILSVEDINNKQKNSNKPNKPKKEKVKRKKEKKYEYSSQSVRASAVEAVKIVRVFAIALIIFGIFYIGTGSYAMYKNSQEEANVPTKPVISATLVDKEVQLSVDSVTTIDEVVYKWNNETETKISGNGRTTIQENIPCPSGENNLYIRVTNASGQTEVLQNTFIRSSDIEITIKQEDPYINISLNSVNKIAYMTYRWNEEEEERIEVNNTQFKQQIKAKEGENTLTIVAVDVNNEMEEKVQKVRGTVQQTNNGNENTGENNGDNNTTTNNENGNNGLEGNQSAIKPTVQVTANEDKSAFKIHATDLDGLTKIEFIINEERGFFVNLNGEKEYDYEYPLEDGENKLEVTAYNVNNVKSETFRALYRK